MVVISYTVERAQTRTSNQSSTLLSPRSDVSAGWEAQHGRVGMGRQDLHMAFKDCHETVLLSHEAEMPRHA